MPDQGLLDVLRRSGGVAAIARQAAINPSEALAVATALMSFVRGGMCRRVEHAGNPGDGLSALIGEFQRLGGGMLAGRVLQHDGVLDQLDLSSGDPVVTAIFGSGDVAEKVVAQASRDSGIDRATVARILPLLAKLAGGYVAARAGGMAPADQLAELRPLLDLGSPANPLDAIS